jgi:DNA mismatch repair ATPase MutS
MGNTTKGWLAKSSTEPLVKMMKTEENDDPEKEKIIKSIYDSVEKIRELNAHFDNLLYAKGEADIREEQELISLYQHVLNELNDAINVITISSYTDRDLRIDVGFYIRNTYNDEISKAYEVKNVLENDVMKKKSLLRDGENDQDGTFNEAV